MKPENVNLEDLDFAIKEIKHKFINSDFHDRNMMGMLLSFVCLPDKPENLRNVCMSIIDLIEEYAKKEKDE